jgi:hypothetical protein
MDGTGQSALFDAFLFFVIALVASGAVLAYTSLSLAEDEGAARAEALAYAEDVRVALLRTTLEDAWYDNGTGGRVSLGQGVTVERFLLDEIQLLARGLTSENFAEADALILARARSLVRAPYDVGIGGSLLGHAGAANLWLGDGDAPPADRFTASWSYETVDGSTVTIEVHLWTT